MTDHLLPVPDYLLSDTDAETVRRTTAAARREGPSAVTSAVAIHARRRAIASEDLRLLLVEVNQLRRSIAMRDEALRLLEGPS